MGPLSAGFGDPKVTGLYDRENRTFVPRYSLVRQERSRFQVGIGGVQVLGCSAASSQRSRDPDPRLAAFADRRDDRLENRSLSL